MKPSLLTKNFASLAASNFAVQALRFLTIALLARHLGTTLFGIYNYVLLILGYGFTLVEFGLKNVAIREFSQGRGSADLTQHIVMARLWLALLAVGGVVALSCNAFPGGQYTTLVLVLGASLFIDAFLVDFIVISQERLWAQAVANVSQAAFVYLGVVLLVHVPEDFLKVGVIYLVSHVLWVSLFFISYRGVDTHEFDSESRSKALWSFQALWAVALSGIPFLVAQLFGGFQASMDLLLLGQFRHQNLLGDYGAALKILGISLGVIHAFVAASQPGIARESHSLKSKKLRSLVYATTKKIALVVIPTVFVCWLFGEQLIHLFFGPKFLLAPELLKPLSLSFAAFSFSLAPLTALYVSHERRHVVAVPTLQCAMSVLCVTAALLMGRADMVPWAMVIAQTANLLISWRVVVWS